MESALEVHNYLPLTYPKESESDYVRFLWEAFESNYSAGKYQFAMLAFHMLYMSYVYFSVWQIKLAKPDAFKHAVLFQQKEKELLNASSPFTFSEVNERSIFRFLRLAGCENQHIGQFQDLVDQRNKIAHSNGNIFFSDQTTAEQRIEEVMQQIRGIQQHITPVLQHSFIEFIRESANPDEREIEDAAVHVEINFMHKHYLSRKDIETCLACDLSEFDLHEHKPSIDELIKALKEKLEL
jgi:hypothetical protein